MAKSPDPTFEVRFVAPGIAPEAISLHSINEALTAIQDLAAGRDPLSERPVPPEKSIRLLKVRRGSAVYSCVSRAPDEASRNLREVARMLSGMNGQGVEDDVMVSAFRPIETLSAVARATGCRLELYQPNNRAPLFAVGTEDFERLSSRLLLTGDTTVIGEVVRAGGATDMKCLLRVPGRKRLLYCRVETRDLVRKLGQHLYEQIAAIGTAMWIHRSWYLYRFKIRSFTQPKMRNVATAIKKLREAGLKAWDNIDDPDAYLKEMGS